MKNRKQPKFTKLSKRSYKKDPDDSSKIDHGEGGEPKFSGQGGSKTMKIAGGKLPPPQKKHLHRQRNAARSKRAK